MNFVEVIERENKDKIFLNVDNIIAVYPLINSVITNGTANNELGNTASLIYRFDDENMKIILNAINLKKIQILNE